MCILDGVGELARDRHVSAGRSEDDVAALQKRMDIAIAESLAERLQFGHAERAASANVDRAEERRKHRHRRDQAANLSVPSIT